MEALHHIPIWYRYVAGLGIVFALPVWTWCSLRLQPNHVKQKRIYWLLRSCSLALLLLAAISILWSWHSIPRSVLGLVSTGAFLDVCYNEYLSGSKVTRWLAVFLALLFVGMAVFFIVTGR